MSQNQRILGFIKRSVLFSLFIGIVISALFMFFMLFAKKSNDDVILLAFLGSFVWAMIIVIFERLTSGLITYVEISVEKPEELPVKIKNALKKEKYQILTDKADVSKWKTPGISSEWKYIGADGFAKVYLENLIVDMKDDRAILTGPRKIVKNIKKTIEHKQVKRR